MWEACGPREKKNEIQKNKNISINNSTMPDIKKRLGPRNFVQLNAKFCSVSSLG